MARFFRMASAGAGLLVFSSLLLMHSTRADNLDPPNIPPGTPAQQTLGQNPNAANKINELTNSAGDLLLVPQVKIIPGDVELGKIKNPVGDDPNAATRGMKYFNSFNCVGCHAANGGGGMGLSLSNSVFKFGSDPASIYLVISHGAPLGMPAWGSVLPDNIIWDMVAYIESISKAPGGQWGTTVNPAVHMPAIEQVPAEFRQTATPWDYTQPFSNGRKPTNHPSSTVGAGPPPPGSQ
ncbi:MAG TPA: cytochrome c [Xanthobacteraceae bacterium]